MKLTGDLEARRSAAWRKPEIKRRKGRSSRASKEEHQRSNKREQPEPAASRSNLTVSQESNNTMVIRRGGIRMKTFVQRTGRGDQLQRNEEGETNQRPHRTGTPVWQREPF